VSLCEHGYKIISIFDDFNEIHGVGWHPFCPQAPNASSHMPCDPSQVYQPEADTYLLVEAALREVRPGERVIEIGTGAGQIASRLSPVAPVVATDINPHAAISARELGIDVVRADLFSGIKGPFDLVVFNPPYLPTLPEERIDDWLEYALDGGENGRAVIERFVTDVSRVIAPGGRILLLISELTGLQETKDLILKQDFSCEIIAETDAEGEMLYVLKCIRP
jgi:release factor glutamine methyltransferase